MEAENDNDGVGEADGDANCRFEQQIFDTIQEPMYVIVDPMDRRHFRVVAKCEVGIIDNVDEFTRFLRDPAKFAR